MKKVMSFFTGIILILLMMLFLTPAPALATVADVEDMTVTVYKETEDMIVYRCAFDFSNDATNGDSTANHWTQAMYIGYLDLSSSLAGIDVIVDAVTGSDFIVYGETCNDLDEDHFYTWTSDAIIDCDSDSDINRTTKLSHRGASTTTLDSAMYPNLGIGSLWLRLKIDGQAGNPDQTSAIIYVYAPKRAGAPAAYCARVQDTTE